MSFLAPSPKPLRRWLDAFVALPDRVKFPLAVILALLAHALIFVIAWAWPLLVQLLIQFSLLPSSRTATYVAPKPTPEPARLEVVLHTPTPEPRVAEKPTPPPAELAPREEKLLKELFAQLPPERQREYLDVEGLARKKNMSTRALLESWRDSVAGSRKRGNGNEPLPTIDGMKNMSFTQLADREVSLGKPKDPEAAEAPALPPLFKPKPVNPAVLAANTTVETADPVETQAPPTPTPTPQPKPVAKATPPPSLHHVTEATADQIPIFLNRMSEPDVPANVVPSRPQPPEPTPKPVQKPTPEPTATPAPKPTPKTSPKPTPKPLDKPRVEPQSVIVAAKLDPKQFQPRPVLNPGYSPQMRRTKVEGANLAPGDDGVDAVGTPAGRYKKAVSSAVGSRWNYFIQQRMSLLQTGKVLVIFSIDARGKLRGFHVEENTSNSAHAALVEQCVREAEFDPPPPEMLRNGVFEYPMSFNLY